MLLLSKVYILVPVLVTAIEQCNLNVLVTAADKVGSFEFKIPTENSKKYSKKPLNKRIELKTAKMRASSSQYQLLVNFMERNADIGKFETDLSSDKWGELTRKLNVETTGEQKTVVAWKKVWKNLKKNAKRKSARINKSVSVGATQCRPSLSELEQRVMSVLRPLGAARLSTAPKIKVEVPEVQMANPVEELISSNCSPSYDTVQSHYSTMPQTQNSDVQSRLQNNDVSGKLIKIELPLSPIASEMQIVPFNPKTEKENIRATNPNCPARQASRRRRYCPYTRQAPPPLMCETVWNENRHLGQFNEYLRLWSWQLRQNERFLNIYRNKY
ncbi:unnamed protein product, partial [Brenthis ino]